VNVDTQAPREARRSPDPAASDDGNVTAPRPFSESLAAAFRHLESTVESALTLLRVRRDRAALSYRRTIARAALVAILVVAGLVAIVAASLEVVGGIVGGLHALLGGAEWAARLLGGAVVIALVLLAVRSAFARQSRRHMEQLEKKYGRTRVDERDRRRARAPRSQDAA